MGSLIDLYGFESLDQDGVAGVDVGFIDAAQAEARARVSKP